jgi:hypothetical protein
MRLQVRTWSVTHVVCGRGSPRFGVSVTDQTWAGNGVAFFGASFAWWMSKANCNWGLPVPLRSLFDMRRKNLCNQSWGLLQLGGCRWTMSTYGFTHLGIYFPTFWVHDLALVEKIYAEMVEIWQKKLKRTTKWVCALCMVVRPKVF